MRNTLAGVVRMAGGFVARTLPAVPLVDRFTVGAFRQVLLSGVSVAGPLVVTFVVLGAVLDFLADLLAPFARVLVLLGLTAGQDGVLAQGLTALSLVAVVVLTGVLAETKSTSGAVHGVGRTSRPSPASARCTAASTR